MNNYEKIKNLSKEELAKINVKAFTYMSGYSPMTEFHTTNGNIFSTRKEAESFEKDWLSKEEDSTVFDIR